MLVVLLALLAAVALSGPCLAQPTPAPATVDAFRAEPVSWKQADIGEQLVARGDRTVLTGLEDWLAHDDRHIRANVAFVFAGLGDPRGLATLEGIVNDRTPRPWAQGIPTAPGNMDVIWKRVPLAQQTVADRYYAVHVLATLRNKRALRILLPLLGDQDIDYKVAWALGEIGDPSAIPALITALRAPSAHARVSLVDALATLRAIDAIPALRALDHDNAAVPNAGNPVLVSQRVLEAIAYLESLAHSAPVAQNKDGFRSPASVRFLNVGELMDKATASGCRISGTWWCRVGCPVRGIRQEVRIEPDLSDLPAVPHATVVAEIGVDGTGRVRDACMLRGIRPDVDREVIRAMAKWRFAPARVRIGPLAGTPVWPVITVTARVGPAER